MITGRMTPIADAQDLKGRYWLCPSCNIEVFITKAGIDHHCRESKYWAKMDLQQIWDAEQALRAAEERERKIWFNE